MSDVGNRKETLNLRFLRPGTFIIFCVNYHMKMRQKKKFPKIYNERQSPAKVSFLNEFLKSYFIIISYRDYHQRDDSQKQAILRFPSNC